MDATIRHTCSADRRCRLLYQRLQPMGIEIDGPGPYDLRIFNRSRFSKALPRGVSGLLDAYVRGWWDTERLDELTARLLAGGFEPADANLVMRGLYAIRARLFNLQSWRWGTQICQHYDLGTDLFRAMLDRRLVYSGAYWKDAGNLDDAQEAKLELICRKIRLQPGMRVLDIGCGWGSFARYAAETHGAAVTGITISKAQCELGQTLCAGLPVELRLADYRDLGRDTFDAIVSVGMIEHVGYKNYRRLMKIVRRCLEPNGLFLLQTIGRDNSARRTNAWVHRHIFPNGMLPSARQLMAATDGLFVVEDWHNFGVDYDRTLMAWFWNFHRAWPNLRARYGDPFYRMWKCYLQTCAGAFRARKMQLWQIVLSPAGIPGGYTPLR